MVETNDSGVVVGSVAEGEAGDEDLFGGEGEGEEGVLEGKGARVIR